MVRLHSSAFLSSPPALRQTFDDFPWHFAPPPQRRGASAVEMGLGLPSPWSGKGVAQIGAFYSNGWILKGSVSERKGISPPTRTLRATLPSTYHSRQKNTATLTCRKEVTDSFRRNGKVWSVLTEVCAIFAKYSLPALFFFFFAHTHTRPDTPHMFIDLTCHLFSCNLERSWLWWETVFIVSHMDTHFLLTATSGRSLPPNLMTACSTQ